MKEKSIINNLVLAIITAFLMMLSVNVYSQACTGSQLSLTIQNVTNPTPTTVEYDVFIENTGSTVVKLSAFGGNVRYPSGGFAASAVLTVVDQPSASAFPGLLSISPTHTPATQQLRWTQSPIGSAATSVVVPANTPMKFARFRLTNPTAWVGSTAGVLYFSTGGSGISLNTLTVYCNGNTNSTAISLANSNLVLAHTSTVNPVNFTINAPSTCPTAATASNLVSESPCLGAANGSATITLTGAANNSSSVTYTVDGGSLQNATLSAGAFTVSNLTAGSHIVAVTYPSCTAVSTSSFDIGAGAALTTNTTPITACNSYVWNGTTYISSGVYTGTTSNCVTESLNLTITPSSTNTTTITACGSYVWNGTTYTTSGVYTGSTTNCVTESLDLTITTGGTSNITTILACGTYTWANNGQTYTTSGVYTGTTTNCVTEFLNLTITPSSTNTISITACGSYVWNGTTYASSGVYTGTTTNCITQSLNLTITPPDTNTVNVNATPTYFWVFTGQIYTVSGTYQFLDLNNCVLEILNLSLTNDIAEESSNAFTIFPNPTNGNVVISLFSDDQCGLNVYDSQGQLVFENPSISNGEAVNLSDYSPGVYIFRVYTSNQIYTRRIIKN